MRVGGRWSPSYLQESPKLERGVVCPFPARRRENRDQPAAKDSLRLQLHRRYSAATFPPTCRCTYTPPLVGRRVPCPTRVDNVSLAGHGTIRRRVTHRTIRNFPKPSTATGWRLRERRVQEYTRPFSNPVDRTVGGTASRLSLSRSIENKRHRRRTFPSRCGNVSRYYSSRPRRVHPRPISRSSHLPDTWARHISRARRWVTGAVAAVRSDRGSGWQLGDRWVVAGVAVLVAAAVGLGTALSLRLRGAGPCPPSRGHTTGAGRRVRGAGADADAAGPGPRRSIPSPAAFWRGHYQRNCSTRCHCWVGSS